MTGQHKGGSNFCERLKNEKTVRDAGVRQLQAGRVAREPVHGQQVEVERARSAGDAGGAVATKGVLDVEEALEERFRLKIGFQRYDGIGEVGLIQVADRIGLVEAGSRGNETASGHGKNGGRKGCRRGTGRAWDICSERDIGCMHRAPSLAVGGHFQGRRNSLQISSEQGICRQLLIQSPAPQGLHQEVPGLFQPNRWIVLAAAVAVLFFGAEAVLEYYGFGSPALVEPDLTTGYELIPGQHVVRRHPLSDDPVAHLDTDSQGMRSDEPSATKPPGTVRLLFLGDSITYGTTQVDQPHIFSELVHKELAAQIHHPVEVMNAANSGWALANEVAWLKEHSTRQADVVLLCLNSNDPTQPFAELPASGVIPSRAYGWPRGIAEFDDRVLPGLIQKAKAKLGVKSAGPVKEDVDPGVALGHDLSVLHQNLLLLDELNRYVTASRARLVIVYIPMVFEIQDHTFGADGREAVRQWSAANHVPFLYASTLLGIHDTDQYTLRDHIHYNWRGHRLIADSIEDQWKLVEAP